MEFRRGLFRSKGAQAHIDSIDEALAPHRQALAAAAANIEKREARCAEIDLALQPLIFALEERLRMAGFHRSLASKARMQDASLQPPPKAETPDARREGKEWVKHGNSRWC